MEDYVRGTGIMCMMCQCKQASETSEKMPKMLMFGGNRTVMFNFESKLISIVGENKAKSLCSTNKSRAGKSYICKNCFNLVNNTHKHIKKLQNGISGTIRWIKRLRTSGHSAEPTTTGHFRKNSLCPLSVRLAEKVASITCLRINNKLPFVNMGIKEDIMHLSVYNPPFEKTRNKNQDKIYNDLSILSVPKQVSSESREAISSYTQEKSDENIASVKIDSLCKSKNKGPNSVGILSTNKEGKGEQLDQLQNSAYKRFESRLGKALPTACLSSPNSGNEKNDEELQYKLLRRKSEAVSNQHLKDFKRMSLLVKSPQPIKLSEVKNNNIYICGKDGCDWIFSSQFLLKNHLRHFHFDSKPFSCHHPGCHRHFSSPSQLKLHSRSHTGRRPFVCELCGKAFKGSQDLQHHKWTHIEGKLHHCPWPGCDLKYKYKATLKRHYLQHQANPKYVCDFPGCGRGFHGNYELKCHGRLHTGEKPVRCDRPGCGRAFRLPCELTKHRRLVHTGERPFRCTTKGCTAAFVTRGALTSHSTTHCPQANHCCDVCGKTFKHKASYRTHYRVHGGQEQTTDNQQKTRHHHVGRPQCHITPRQPGLESPPSRNQAMLLSHGTDPLMLNVPQQPALFNEVTTPESTGSGLSDNPSRHAQSNSSLPSECRAAPQLSDNTSNVIQPSSPPATIQLSDKPSRHVQPNSSPLRDLLGQREARELTSLMPVQLGSAERKNVPENLFIPPD